MSEMEEEGLDTEGAVESTSKLQSKVKALSGVDILTDTGAYKSTYEILSEIATVWEDMSDIDQAALLEILAGKRAGSVMSAILQNPETLKNAFESASEASGSALEENEKYLDSIQGKIDLFNNSVQTLWKNLLSSDIIKDVISWGTQIIKSLDTTHGKILALVKVVALLMAYKKINPLDWIPKIAETFNTITNTDGGLKQFLGSLLGIAPAIKTVTAETVANTVAMQTNNVAEQQAILQKIGLTSATGALNAEKKEEVANNIALAVTNGQMTVQMGQQMAAMLGYTLSVDAAGKATVALDATTKSFMASNPIGWILLIVSAVMALVMWLGNTKTGVEELREKLSDLKSELQDIKSEINSVNSELETTNDRMAELLAKDSLSFTEKEELDNLKKQNDELQRRLDLLDLEQKHKSRESAETFNSIMQKDVGLDFWGGKGEIWENGEKKPVEYVTVFDAQGNEKFTGKDMSWDAFWNELWWEGIGDGSREWLSETEYLDKQISDYQNASEDDKKNIESVITAKFDEWKKAADGIGYGIDEETDTWLDFIYNYQDKWAVASGGQNAKSNAINRIFNKDENSNISDSINEYVEALKNGDVSSKESIENIIENNKNLVEDLEASGVSIKDAVDYFTLESGAFDSNTLDGIAAQYQAGVNAFKKFNEAQSVSYTSKDGETEEITWENLFNVDEATNKITADTEAIAKVLQGADDRTREEFANLVESVAEGNLDFNQAIKSFGLSGALRGFELVEEQISSMNTSVFKDLGDELSGVIDTFSEFGAALESVANSMDILNTAQTQYNNSGRVSVKTALELINTTDHWNEVLKIENGNIQLVDNAEEILIQTKLDHIKANLQAALSTVEAQLAQIAATGSAQDLATTLEESTNMAVVSLAENMAYLSGLVEAFANGNWGGAIAAAEDARSAVTIKTTSYRSGNTISKSSLEGKKEDILAQMAMLEGISTTSDFKNNYDFDKTPGDKYNDDSSSDSDDAFQKAMDYWENRIAANQARYEQIQNEIDLIEKQGGIAGEEYYKEQIKLENQRLKLLEAQKAEAQKYLATFTEGSDEWWEAASQLADIENSVDDVTASIQDLKDAIAQIQWDVFDESHTRFGNLKGQLETVRELVAPNGEEDWFDDEGNWTEKGVAVAGTYIQEIEIDQNALEDTQKKLADFAKGYKGNEKYFKDTYGLDSEQEYYDKRQELIEQEQEYAKNINSNKQAVVDMYEAQIDAVEEYTGKLIDSYNEYIDTVKEALDAERD